MATKKIPAKKTSKPATKAPTKAKVITYKSIGEIIRAKQKGKLARGFKLITDNDSVSGVIRGQTEMAYSNSDGPREMLEEVMKFLGIACESV